jgi:hypothetical protein
MKLYDESKYLIRVYCYVDQISMKNTNYRMKMAISSHGHIVQRAGLLLVDHT